MKKLRVTVDGTVFEVLIEIPDAAEPTRPSPAAQAPTPAPEARPAPAPVARPAPSAPAPGAVVSPRAGQVVSIDVQVGQTVAEGAQVATLEAMKMNTYVNAPKAGRVASIAVKPGDAVDEGATIVVLD